MRHFMRHSLGQRMEDPGELARLIDSLEWATWGDSIKKFACAMVAKMMTNRCQALYLGQCRKGKLGFNDKKLCQAIVTATKLAAEKRKIAGKGSEGTEDGVTAIIADRLKYAKCQEDEREGDSWRNAVPRCPAR